MNAFDFTPAYAAGAALRRRKMSRQAAVAIGVSVAVHLGVVGYVATQNFDTLKILPNDTPIFSTTIERLPEKPEPPRPKPKDLEPVQKKIAIHDPERPPVNQTVEPIQAEPTPRAVQTDLGPPVIPQSKEPPVQLADNRRIEPPRAKVITNPTWARRPSGAELGRLYPRRAIDLGLSGGATILCEVIADGSVKNCSVVDESPKGKGFGEAALASAKLYRLNPRTVDGETVEGAKVRIPLVFNLAD